MSGSSEAPDGPAVPPIKRRSFLASAALAAGAPATAGTAVAAERAAETAAAPQPVRRPQEAVGRGSVARLLAVPERGRGVGWLKEALQVAVELELSTIPPYLCGWWSITDRRSEAARLIRRIVGDEMYHLGVVCNLLVAVGGRPRIRDAAPVYPGPLPGGVHPGLNVYLSGLTKSLVRDVMMAIEAPEGPLARSAGQPPSVGAFYGDLLKTFRATKPELSRRGQLSERIGSDVLKPVGSLDAVEHSIEIIKEQGEGTAGSPADTLRDDHPAHYYAFGEIYHGRRLRETDDGWRFAGAPVPFPDARPMARVPHGGWPHPSARARRLLDHFDVAYSAVLSTLDRAWDEGSHHTLQLAVHAMRGLESPAVELMEIDLPDRPGVYGPQFRRR
ncbi:ferritin-like protein [Streptomyces caniferus]|uniref:ferritin-like domain-containing protein n=1 Tax=Streptomyces caniferus TaxID=285557 RepID=UPI003719D5DC